MEVNCQMVTVAVLDRIVSVRQVESKSPQVAHRFSRCELLHIHAIRDGREYSTRCAKCKPNNTILHVVFSVWETSFSMFLNEEQSISILKK